VCTTRGTAAHPTLPVQRGATGLAPSRQPRGTGTRTAAARAYARRDERAGRARGMRADRATAGRPRFALLMMVLLATGLVATLWLSTAAAADSYRLEDARTAAREMSEQSERLHREVATLSSPTSLAERAGALGMVPMQDSPRLVIDPEGDVVVVGVPKVATAPAPPAPPCPPAPPEGAEPAETAEPATPAVACAPGGPAPVGPDGAQADPAPEVIPGAQGGDTTGTGGG
jgi:hypothetical protein